MQVAYWFRTGWIGRLSRARRLTGLESGLEEAASAFAHPGRRGSSSEALHQLSARPVGAGGRPIDHKEATMTLATAADLLTAALQAGRGVGAMNVIQIEHVEAIIAGAERSNSPVIVQISGVG